MATASDVFRDYNTDGDSSSGRHNVVKSEVRSLFANFVTPGGPQIITASGSQSVGASTGIVLLNKGSISDTPLLLPSVFLFTALELEIYDYSGKGGHVTLAAFAGQNIMGGSTLDLGTSGGVAQSGVSVRLVCVPALSGWTFR